MIVLKGGNKKEADDDHLQIYSYNTASDFNMEVEHFEAKIKPKKEKHVDEQGLEWEEVYRVSSIKIQHKLFGLSQ